MKKALFCLIFAVCSFFCFGEDIFFGYDKYMTLSEMKSMEENEDVLALTDNYFEFAFETKKTFSDYDCVLTCRYIKNSHIKYEIDDNIFTVDFLGLFSEYEVLDFINNFFGDNVLYKPKGNSGFIVSTCEKAIERKELNLTVTPFMSQYILSYSWRLYK